LGALGVLGALGRKVWYKLLSWCEKSYLWIKRAFQPVLFHLRPVLHPVLAWFRDRIVSWVIKEIQWLKIGSFCKRNLVHISVVVLAVLVVFGNLNSSRLSGLTVIPTGAKRSIGRGMPALGQARPANLIATSNDGFIIKAAEAKSPTPTPAPKPQPAPPPPQAATGNFAWPVSAPNITQGFGWTRFNPWHTGVDMTSPDFTIYVSDSGWVEGTFWDPYGYGNHILVNHGNGYETLYAHLSQSWVYPGQFVSKGQAIGYMGSTGWSTGTHLHFEVRSGGAILNPFDYLP